MKYVRELNYCMPKPSNKYLKLFKVWWPKIHKNHRDELAITDNLFNPWLISVCGIINNAMIDTCIQIYRKPIMADIDPVGSFPQNQNRNFAFGVILRYFFVCFVQWTPLLRQTRHFSKVSLTCMQIKKVKICRTCHKCVY